MKEKIIKTALMAVAIIVAAALLANAYTYKFRSQDVLVVTGLGEKEFSSDMIVWSATIVVESPSRVEGYAQLERNRQQVSEFLKSNGVPDSAISFQFVNVDKMYASQYNSEGNYVGQFFTGNYQLRQQFNIQSKEVAKIEGVSREISSLIAKGLNIEANMPDYYCTELDEIKMELIEQASQDAYTRAQKIADNAGAKLGKVSSARMGVFQITGANSNEEYLSGGAFNTSSLMKKGSITVRVEYRIK